MVRPQFLLPRGGCAEWWQPLGFRATSEGQGCHRGTRELQPLLRSLPGSCSCHCPRGLGSCQPTILFLLPHRAPSASSSRGVDADLVPVAAAPLPPTRSPGICATPGCWGLTWQLPLWLCPWQWVSTRSPRMSLCSATPQSLIPPPYYSKEGSGVSEWAQGGAMQGDAGGHCDIPTQLRAGDGGEVASCPRGDRSRWMVAGMWLPPSAMPGGRGSGGGDELARAQRGAGAGSLAGPCTGGAGVGRARLPSAPSRQSWGQTPACGHQTHKGTVFV